MQAALGFAQLERIDELVERKREIFAWYEAELGNLEGITLNYEPPDTKNTYWMVTAVLDEKLGIKKERLMELLGEQNIDCRPFFYPLSSIPAYNGWETAQVAVQNNLVSYQISPFGVNLPCGMNMTEELVKYVCDVLKKILLN
jgi:perosamine synthetase